MLVKKWSSTDTTYFLYLLYCVSFLLSESFAIDMEEGSDGEIMFGMLYGTFVFVVLPVAAVFASMENKPREAGLIILAIATVFLYLPTVLGVFALVLPLPLTWFKLLPDFRRLPTTYFLAVSVLSLRWLIQRRRLARAAPAI